MQSDIFIVLFLENKYYFVYLGKIEVYLLDHVKMSKYYAFRKVRFT